MDVPLNDDHLVDISSENDHANIEQSSDAPHRRSPLASMHGAVGNARGNLGERPLTLDEADTLIEDARVEYSDGRRDSVDFNQYVDLTLTSVDWKQQEKKNMKPMAATYTLMSSMFGAGVLAMPFGFDTAGVAGGFFVLTFLGVGAAFSSYLLWLCSRKMGARSYEEIAELLFGRRGRLVTLVSMFLLVWSGLVSYMILWWDVGAPAFEALNIISQDMVHDDKVLSFRTLCLIGLSFVAFPICVMRTLDKLRYLTLAGFIAISLLCGFLIYSSVDRLVAEGLTPRTYPDDEDKARCVKLEKPTVEFGFLPSMSLCIAVTSTAYIGIFNLLPVTATEMQQPTKARTKKIIGATFSIVGLIYTSVGVMLYLYAFDSVRIRQVSSKVFNCYVGPEGNILLNGFPYTHSLITVGRFGVFAALFLHYSLLLNPSRSLCHRFIFGERAPAPSRIKHVIATILIMLSSLVVAILVPKIQVILAFNGSTVGLLCTYVLPPLFYVVLHPKKPWTDRTKFTAYAILITGIAMMPFVTILQIVQWDRLSSAGTNVLRLAVDPLQTNHKLF